MGSEDVKETLEIALENAGIQQVKVKHRPQLLSDNGPCYISNALKDYLQQNQIKHVRGAPYHPMTQGKIERAHNLTNQSRAGWWQSTDQSLEQSIQALSLYQDVGNPFGIPYALNTSASFLIVNGQLNEAQKFLEDSLIRNNLQGGLFHNQYFLDSTVDTPPNDRNTSKDSFLNQKREISRY